MYVVDPHMTSERLEEDIVGPALVAEPAEVFLLRLVGSFPPG